MPEVGRSDRGVVSLHRSHYLKSSGLKQKVRDQQILTSGQAYDSILMQFSLSNSLIITVLPANLISHLSKFRHISLCFNFHQTLALMKHSPGCFSKTIYSLPLIFFHCWHAHTDKLFTRILHLRSWSKCSDKKCYQYCLSQKYVKIKPYLQKKLLNSLFLTVCNEILLLLLYFNC